MLDRLRKIVAWWRRRQREAQEQVLYERRIVVEERDGCLTAKDYDGEVYSMPWEAIVRFEVHTNDTGPWGSDLWYVLFGREDGRETVLAFPQGATGEYRALARLREIISYDQEIMWSAAGCVRNEVFVCWTREGEG